MLDTDTPEGWLTMSRNYLNNTTDAEREDEYPGLTRALETAAAAREAQAAINQILAETATDGPEEADAALPESTTGLTLEQVQAYTIDDLPQMMRFWRSAPIGTFQINDPVSALYEQRLVEFRAADIGAWVRASKEVGWPA